ncbi:hypothetical protein [Anaeromyxobacter diazotrophicus]|uniref:Uncharacterized protein n=1 Tax=Anaeromyxobacter diazotrophicus TaxID=2590199 RepID=A0A7I9VGQ1_9BACT|nr:hypothetical protein [Anaeromyxobacter diazotrophicus]GEJ55310.1 hypothetical protein AMYX_00510 [Anaeromyxobacter diazotrophicus]
MAPTTRVTLARDTYLAALRAARAHSTARTWARLLRAARNLREASTEAERQVVRDRRPRP